VRFRLHIFRYQAEDYKPKCGKPRQNATRHALRLHNHKTHEDKICV